LWFGVGANVQVGGSSDTISLQPVSIEGGTGLNVAAGFASISLTFQLSCSGVPIWSRIQYRG